MHHLLEIFIWLLAALVLGWLLGRLLRCRLFRPADVPAPERRDQSAAPQPLMAQAPAAEAAQADAAASTAEEADATAREVAEAATPSAGAEQAPVQEQAGTEEEAAREMPAHGLSAPVGEPDDLQMISGIGPKLEKLLHDMGIYHFAQIAAWTEKDIAEIDAKLKFKGRIEREEWVRQAKLLAEGKLEQFEREYGTGGKKGADGKARPGSRTRRGGGDVAAAEEKRKEDAEKALPAHGLSAPVGEPDDLQMISGIGPKLEKLLHDMGIYHFAQIAAWTEKDIAEIDAKLKFKGRIEREEWVRQAKLLAEGKLEQFEREYGTGGKKDASGKSRSGTRTRRKKQ